MRGGSLHQQGRASGCFRPISGGTFCTLPVGFNFCATAGCLDQLASKDRRGRPVRDHERCTQRMRQVCATIPRYSNASIFEHPTRQSSGKVTVRFLRLKPERAGRAFCGQEHHLALESLSHGWSAGRSQALPVQVHHRVGQCGVAGLGGPCCQVPPSRDS